MTTTTPHDGHTCACACHNAASQPCYMPGGCGVHWGAERASDRASGAHEPTEVTKVARNLSAIEDMTAALLTQAVHKANDAAMPGGAAMVSLASVASPEAWEHVFEAREGYGLSVTHIDDEDDTWEPPLQTLLFWSEQWRTEHGYELEGRPTIASETNFIRWCLNWAWENELHFEDFARDIHQARLRMENLLYAGRRAERSRVTCIALDCERAPRLIKVHGARAVDDRWKCPACKRIYDGEEFTLAKANLLGRTEAARHVKMQDAREAIGRSDRTFRKWMRFWYVRSYRDPITGQVWVWWPDVRETHLRTQTRTTRREDEEVA